MTQLTTEELMRVLNVVLEEFRRDIDKDIPAVRIQTLTTVCEHPGIQKVDLDTYISGLSLASSSRNVTSWTEVDRHGEKAPGFMTSAPDPRYRRRHILQLTPRGEKFIDSLTKKVNASLATQSNRSATG